jgi:tetratricopeptide (TPR) repeat protein
MFNNFQKAIQIYEELLGMGVDRLGCLTNLGTMYHTCGLHQKAVHCFQELIDLKHIDYNVLIK